VITLRPAEDQEALDLLELQYEQHRARLGFEELFESGTAGDLTGCQDR
jgi:hypothetical protein